MLEKLAEKLGQRLKECHFKLVTAESCTGGGLAYAITATPGSSDWFERGFVTYSNSAKIDCLKIDPAIINQYGAVSEETARAMAEGALKNSYGNMSIAITGIAGPDGGTPEKPIGTVWFAWACKIRGTRTQLKHFTGSRQQIREQSIRTALENLFAFVEE
ncbi:MAG: CinA family protein [Gammaproteobacteria bacterium]|nr:CinA family protein [Gammaproteobacteria bacterium]